MRQLSGTVDLFATEAPGAEEMGAWDVLVGLLEPVAVGVLLIALGWAASERGRIHQYLAQQRRVAGGEAPGPADRFSTLTGQ